MEEQKIIEITPLPPSSSPTLYHSFVYCLTTVLTHLDENTHAVDVFGKSSFAFRVYTNQLFCPSAQSCFSFKEILPHAVEQNGYHCSYLEKSIGDNEENLEVIDVAHQMIHEAINNNIPVIAWDIFDTEWGVIYGFDDKTDTYTALNHTGETFTFPYKKLGKNGTKFLSITIPGPSNGTTDQEAFFNLLHSIKDHLTGNEKYDMDGTYAIGISAYDIIMDVLKKWIQILETGKEKDINIGLLENTRYNINHLYSARFYAVKYLEGFADSDLPRQLHRYYEKIEQLLKKQYVYFNKSDEVKKVKLESFVKDFCRIKSLETEILNIIS